MKSTKCFFCSRSYTGRICRFCGSDKVLLVIPYCAVVKGSGVTS